MEEDSNVFRFRVTGEWVSHHGEVESGLSVRSVRGETRSAVVLRHFDRGRFRYWLEDDAEERSEMSERIW